MNDIELKMEIVNNCPICNADRNTNMGILLEIHEKRLVLEGDKIYSVQYVFCKHCGFIFHNPRLTEGGWRDFYEKIYYKFLEMRGSGGSTRGSNFINTLARAKHQIPFIRKYVPKVGYHLDIGCQMDQLQREVTAVYNNESSFGTELDEEFRGIANKLGAAIFPTEDDIPEHLRGKFDLITMSHSLEHMNWPVEYLIKMRDFLSDDGYVFVEVPCLWWIGSLQISHPGAFTKHTLKEALRSAGYKVVAIKYTGSSTSRYGWLMIHAVAKKTKLNPNYKVKRDRFWAEKFSLFIKLCGYIKWSWKQKWFFGNRLGQAIWVDKKVHPAYIQHEFSIKYQELTKSGIRSSPTSGIELYSSPTEAAVEFPPRTELT